MLDQHEHIRTFSLILHIQLKPFAPTALVAALTNGIVLAWTRADVRAVNCPWYNVCVAGNILFCRRQWLIARLPWFESRATVFAVFERPHKDKSLQSSHCLWLTVTLHVGTHRLSHSSLIPTECQSFKHRHSAHRLKQMNYLSRYPLTVNSENECKASNGTSEMFGVCYK